MIQKTKASTIALAIGLGVMPLGAWAQSQAPASPNAPPSSAPGNTTAPMTPSVRPGQTPGEVPPAGGASRRDDAAPRAGSPDSGSGAVRTGQASGPLQQGANSFTEGQARSRIEGAGYSNVTGLTLDGGGVWRGRAMRNGQQVDVGLDYQGNIAAQ